MYHRPRQKKNTLSNLATIVVTHTHPRDQTQNAVKVRALSTELTGLPNEVVHIPEMNIAVGFSFGSSTISRTAGTSENLFSLQRPAAINRSLPDCNVEAELGTCTWST